MAEAAATLADVPLEDRARAARMLIVYQTALTVREREALLVAAVWPGVATITLRDE